MISTSFSASKKTFASRSRHILILGAIVHEACSSRLFFRRSLPYVHVETYPKGRVLTTSVVPRLSSLERGRSGVREEDSECTSLPITSILLTPTASTDLLSLGCDCSTDTLPRPDSRYFVSPDGRNHGDLVINPAYCLHRGNVFSGHRCCSFTGLVTGVTAKVWIKLVLSCCTTCRPRTQSSSSLRSILSPCSLGSIVVFT